MSILGFLRAQLESPQMGLHEMSQIRQSNTLTRGRRPLN